MTLSTDRRPPSSKATLTVAAGMSSLGVMPAFLLGSLAALVRADLGMTHDQVGVAISVFLAAYAVTSVPGGRAADRIGARRALGWAAVVVVLAAFAIATVASAPSHVITALVLAGAAMGVADPSGNLALTRALTPDRQGLAFGLKESAGPGATLLTGLAIPTIALTLGWRWTFAACALLISLLMILLPQLPGPDGDNRRPRGQPRGHAGAGLLPLAAAAGLGSAAAIAMSAFFVESVATAGLSLSDAGLLLAAGSTVGIGARLAAGWSADRWGLGLGTVGIMLLGGAAGSVVLGTGPTGWPLLIGTTLAFGCGWGWAGLLVFSVVRLRPHDAGAATGTAGAGLAGGAAVGPALFGILSARQSLSTAWTVNAGLALAAAALIAAIRWRAGSPHAVGPPGISGRDR